MGNVPLIPKSRFGRHDWRVKLPVWKELSEQKPAEDGSIEVIVEDYVYGHRKWRRDLEEPAGQGWEFNRCKCEDFFGGLREWVVSMSVTGASFRVHLWAEEHSPQVSVSVIVTIVHPTKAKRWTGKPYDLTFKSPHDYAFLCGSFPVKDLESGGWLDNYRLLHLEVEVMEADFSVIHFPAVSEYIGSSGHDDSSVRAHPSKVCVGKFPDTAVVVEGYRVDTHRARLATRSTTFESMFSSQPLDTCTAVQQSVISLSDVVGISLPGFAYCLENIYQDLNRLAPLAEPKQFVIDIITCADYLHMADYLNEMLTLLQKYLRGKPHIPVLLSRLQALGLISGPAYDALRAPCRQFVLSCLSTPSSPILPSVPFSMITDMLEDKLLHVIQAETLRSWIRKRHKEWSSECVTAVLKAMWKYPKYEVNVIEYILLLKDIGQPVTNEDDLVVWFARNFPSRAPKTPQEWERFKLLPRRIQSSVLTAQLEGVSEDKSDEDSKEDGDSSATPCKRKFNELS